MNKTKRMTYAELEEIFGIKRNTIKYRIKSGMTLKDTLTTPINSHIIDLTGKHFTRLVALYRIPGTHTEECKWHCLCDCGNECDVSYSNLVSGRQQSCGCLNMERRCERENLSGQIINGVKILYSIEDEITKNGIHYPRYRCVCPHCRNEFDARAANIKSGNTGGCGCTRHQYTHHIDLTGLNFEFCHVNKRIADAIQPSGGSRVMYECTCVCNTIYSDWANTIMHGRSNCGCKRIISKGEETIKQWLNNHNVIYISGYWFDDLRGRRNMPYYFDFALFDDNYNLLGLIEYQGEQHFFEDDNEFGKYQREVSDPAKKKYCKSNNIRLFEITYNENTIDKCNYIYNLLYHDNTVPSSN